MQWLYMLNFILALSGLALLVATAFLFVDYFYFGRRYFIAWVQAYVWQLILVTTIGSVALSLVYSEYFGFVPCSLCWLQRIALYPQALMALVTFKRQEREHFATYSIALSGFGVVVAVYHYIYQMVPKESLTAGIMPCLADGTGDCATKIINEFGFVTFPFLSAVTFTFLIILYLNLRRL